MSDQGPSVADIQAAHNQKLAGESGIKPQLERIAAELQGAHQDALHLKDRERRGEDLSMQGQQQQHQAGMGEKLVEGLASADQGVTTTIREGVHRLSEGVSAAGNAAANAAGDAVDKAKEAVQSTMVARAANHGGVSTTGYEGAVFSSDDPDYKQTGAGSGVTESRTPAHTLDELKGDSPNPTIATPKEDTLAHNWDLPLRGLASRLGQGSAGPGRGQVQAPVVASPKEGAPASLGEGCVGVAAGDPAGGANVVAAAKTAGKGIVASVKDAFTGTPGDQVAGAPAGPSDPDPRTANVPVGDFRALHEALGIATPDNSRATASHHHSSSGGGGEGGAGASDVSSRGTTDQDNAGALPSTQQVKEGWEGLKSQAQEGVNPAKERVQEGLNAASEKAQEAVGGGTDSSSGTAAAGGSSGGGGILGGLAGIVSGIATKVNLANSSEELLAGRTVPDAAAGPAAADGPTSAPAPEAGAAADAAAAKASDATAAAKDAAAGAAERVQQGAAELRDKSADQATAVKDSVRETARDAADAGSAAKQTAADEVAAARDSAAEAMGAAGDKASGAAKQAKEAAGGGLASLIQGAKEGFVGAYDAAASVLVGDDKASGTAPQADGSPSGPTGGTPAAAQPASNTAGATAASGLQSGAVGSGHAAAPQAGIGAVLKQGWEDVKHGGAKAPHATSTGGETSAAHDVTSNIERSKHLDDDQQAKIYKAETYSVSPGAQASADQAATDASGAGAVAGDKRPVTGTVPHDKPDSYQVHAGQKTRFDGNKGMATGFGTGSAAPWSGDTSIKDTHALFSSSTPHNSLDMGGLSPGQQAALAEAAAQAGLPQADRAGSSSEGGVRSWVSSMSAVWRHLGVASAKGPGEGKTQEGPSTQDIKDNIQWDNPTQDAVIDPVHGVTKKEGHSPHHKIQMRTGKQIPPDTDPSDPGFFKSKVERLGKVVADSITSTPEEAAADPKNLKGKSSDNKPDGLAHFTKREAESAADALGRAPEAAVSALGTAGEMVSGAAGHVVDKAKEMGHNITTYGDFKTPEERAAKSKAAVERMEKQMEGMGDIVTDHRAVQELQEQRMAAIGNPAHRRETLGDKVIGPMVSDASDDTHARELAASYNEWKAEKEHGSSSATGHAGSDSGGGSSGVSHAVQGLGQEASDTARSTKEVVKMEGQAAGEGVRSAAAKAGHKAGGAVEAVKGLAAEAADTAKATGEVVSMEVSQTADAVKGKADQATSHAGHAARDAKASAQDTAQRVSDSARDTAQRVGDSARDTANRTGDTVRDAANRTGDAACDTAQRAGDSVRDTAQSVGDSVRGTAQRAGDSVRETAQRAGDSVHQTADSAKDAASRAGDSERDTASRAGEKLQEGVDAVAEGTGYVAGAGAETLTEAQEAAARAGEKAGSAAGGVLASVGDAAKGLLGALLGPFEREGAFDESTAAVTGPARDFEPIGVEQLSGSAAAPSEPQAPAVKRAPITTSTAAAPAGADTTESLREVTHDTKEGLKARLQAGLDDTARAAGLTAGHIESTVEGTVEAAKQQLAAVQEKAAQVTEHIQVPPAEIPTNTEDLIRQRQAQLQQ